MTEDRKLLVLNEAASWIGTPFVHQGAIKGVGVGCGTLLMEVYRAAGFKVPSLWIVGHFPADWHKHAAAGDDRYLAILLEFCEQVVEPEPADIVLFKMGNVYAHSGVVVDWPREIIHVMWKRQVQYINPEQGVLQNREFIFLRPNKV